MKYTLINYFDVWGNAKDGYEVNNQCVEERGIFISDAATDKEIVSFLESAGYLNTSDLRKVTIVYDGENLEIYQKREMLPLFCLQPEY